LGTEAVPGQRRALRRGPAPRGIALLAQVGLHDPVAAAAGDGGGRRERAGIRIAAAGTGALPARGGAVLGAEDLALGERPARRARETALVAGRHRGRGRRLGGRRFRRAAGAGRRGRGRDRGRARIRIAGAVSDDDALHGGAFVGLQELAVVEDG